MKKSPKKIFISYRRSDTSAEARSLFGRLSDHFGRDRVFLDVTGIGKGVDFTGVLKEALAATGAIIVLIGPDWASAADESGNARLSNADDYVRLEVETALSSGIPVIPVLVSGAQMPPAAALPPSLQRLPSFMGTTLTHSNYESDTDALVRDLESLIGRQPLLVRVLSWTPAIGRSVSRLPTALKVVVGAVVVIATLSIFVPHGVQTAVAESRALIKVAGSNDRIPLSRDAAADMKAILASTADKYCDEFRRGGIWGASQDYAACGGPAKMFREFELFVNDKFDSQCQCWRDEGKALTFLYFWVFEAYSMNRKAIDPKIVTHLVSLQAKKEGWWPTMADRQPQNDNEPQNDQAPLYVTALITIALKHQLPLLSPDLASDVENAINKAAQWLAKNEPGSADEWADYPGSERLVKHQLFGGMALVAVAGTLSQNLVTQMAERWSAALRFDPASKFIGSDSLLDRETRTFDRYRHVPLTWQLCGLAAAWPYLSSYRKAVLLPLLEERLQLTGRSPNAFERGWVQADISYCLRNIEAKAF